MNRSQNDKLSCQVLAEYKLDRPPAISSLVILNLISVFLSSNMRPTGADGLLKKGTGELDLEEELRIINKKSYFLNIWIVTV